MKLDFSSRNHLEFRLSAWLHKHSYLFYDNLSYLFSYSSVLNSSKYNASPMKGLSNVPSLCQLLGINCKVLFLPLTKHPEPTSLWGFSEKSFTHWLPVFKKGKERVRSGCVWLILSFSHPAVSLPVVSAFQLVSVSAVSFWNKINDCYSNFLSVFLNTQGRHYWYI